ncbi:hypothetical protein [Aquisphaera insulae]|uniref:hypothetical protein n=1 Tax=Aquisphaera insulae TaxID=2712864 RepID=UPI0013ECDE49|nr:hypothetical protein [Aquisphaera insulae]
MHVLLRPLRSAEAVLRGRGETTVGRDVRPVAGPTLGLMILGFGMFYGGVMGLYGGLSGHRLWQPVFSAVKVPFLIVTTFVLSVPSFYVVNALLGLRADFPRVLRALVTTQAGLTAILASLAPLTAFWYASKSPYQAAILFNGLMFAVASLGAQWILRREYRPLIQKDGRHRWLLRAWILIYVFVGIQMGWVLRPFIGDPLSPVQFFRQDSWSNAYEVVLRMGWDVLAGRGR